METDSFDVAPQRHLSIRNLRRAGSLTAALITAALLAGCGTASSSGSSTTSASGTAASAGSPTGTTTDAFNPNLVPKSGTAPGTSPQPTKPATKASAKAKTAPHKAPSTSSGAAASTPPVTHPAPAPAPAPTPSPAPSGGGTQTITVSHTSTVTVTKYVRPHVPAGAGLPSRYRAASVSRFDAAGGDIGCRILGGTVRCDVGRRVWSPPHKPRSCHAAWGQGLMIGGSGGTSFVCSRNSVLDPTGYYIRPGYDDKVGSVTCQVRSFGVTCFESDGHGFFVGRTGYTTF